MSLTLTGGLRSPASPLDHGVNLPAAPGGPVGTKASLLRCHIVGGYQLELRVPGGSPDLNWLGVSMKAAGPRSLFHISDTSYTGNLLINHMLKELGPHSKSQQTAAVALGINMLSMTGFATTGTGTIAIKNYIDRFTMGFEFSDDDQAVIDKALKTMWVSIGGATARIDSITTVAKKLLPPGVATPLWDLVSDYEGTKFFMKEGEPEPTKGKLSIVLHNIQPAEVNALLVK